RWRYWNRWFSSDPSKASPTSLVSVATNDNYTRLVLRNPKTGGVGDKGDRSARGGSFVYISVPAALGTDEAHAITVALRGAPPSFSDAAKLSSSSGNNSAAQEDENDVFTVYIKDLGKWTKALRDTARGAEAAGDARSLLVDVDGFYTQVQSFTSMKLAGGASRVVVVAGGSGMTSLMGFIQDWAVAAREGADVPEVNLVWCCRYMSEMKLVGECLPSVLASAGSKKDTHFSMSLYCSGSKADSNEPLTVTWPLDTNAYARTSTKHDVIGTGHVAASLNHSVRVIVAGLAAFAGYILGYWEVDRRDLMNVFHEGGIIFILMVICIISSLIVYDWLFFLVRKHLLGKGVDSAEASQAGERSSRVGEESKMDLESSTVAGVGSVTYDVNPGRVPTQAVLTQEADLAKKSNASSVRVLTSGPDSLVDSVLAESRAIDWKLFDTEAFSFEF
ncbi:unnamed protein product, partial [Ectocarpus fasciculatus]